MSIQIQKDKKGNTWIISRIKDGFTKQLNITIDEIKVLHRLLGDILAGRR